MPAVHTFMAVAEARPQGGFAFALPFDPDEVWGTKERHSVTGTLGGCKVRGPLKRVNGACVLELGPAWARDNNVVAGQQVKVELAPEGPQLDNVAPDLSAALAAAPEALRFFDSLPTFYRKNFVRWIESAKRPETRAKRITETIDTLKAGNRER